MNVSVCGARKNEEKIKRRDITLFLKMPLMHELCYMTFVFTGVLVVLQRGECSAGSDDRRRHTRIGDRLSSAIRFLYRRNS